MTGDCQVRICGGPKFLRATRPKRRWTIPCGGTAMAGSWVTSFGCYSHMALASGYRTAGFRLLDRAEAPSGTGGALR
jgi:hypothetical protein